MISAAQIKAEPEDCDDSEIKFSFVGLIEPNIEVKEENIHNDLYLPVIKVESQFGDSMKNSSTLPDDVDGVKEEIEINDDHEVQESCAPSPSIPDFNDLNVEVLVHRRGKKNFKCNLCDCSNEMVQVKVKHLKCPLCNKSYSRKGDLVAHKRTHLRKELVSHKPYSKSFSDRNLQYSYQQEYKTKYGWMDGIGNDERINKQGKIITNNICEKSDDSKEQDFNLSKKKSHICLICNQEFSDFENLVIHLNTHTKVETKNKSLICKICSNTYICENDYNMHMRIHNGEKPFKCNVCEVSYMFSFQLKAHIESHVNKNCFVCNTCGKSYQCKRKFLLHKRTHAKVTDTPDSLTCQICLKKFDKSGYLSMHMRIHSEKNTYICDICSKEFSEKCNLVKHLRKHSE